MNKKYKLANETICYYGKVLHRIKALRDFSTIKKGDIGGFVEGKNNLSQEGDCWIHDNAKVLGDAAVFGNALVYGNAEVLNSALVYDDAKIFDNARIFETAEVSGNAQIFGRAEVSNDAVVYGNAEVYDYAQIYGYARVFNDAKIFGNASVFGDAHIYGDAEVYNYAKVYGCAEICGDAKVTSSSDYIVFKNWWSSGRYFTWTRSDNMWRVGCFYGTGEELIAKAYKDSELSGKEYERIVRYVEDIYPSVKAIN